MACSGCAKRREKIKAYFDALAQWAKDPTKPPAETLSRAIAELQKREREPEENG